MTNHITDAPAQQDLILQSAFQLSASVVAAAVFHELGCRYSELGYQDTNPAKRELARNNELCKQLARQLESLLGQDFFNNLIADIYDRVEKRQPSKVKLQEGMFAAQILNSSSTFEDLTLATTYGYEIAGEILQKLRDLEAYKNGVQLLEALIGIQTTLTKLPPTEPPLFKQKSITAVPSSFIMISTLEAQTRKDLWKDSDQGAFYRKGAKNNSNNLIEHYVSNPGDITILPWDEAQQIIDKFGFDTAKLHLIFAAHCMNSDEPWDNRFYLKASDIAKYLGWDRRTDLSKNERLNEVAKLAFILGCLLVKGTWFEGQNKKGEIEVSCPVGRMWDVVVEPRGQLNIHGIIDNPYEVIISVRPGGWTEHFLNKAGVKARKALYQFGWLSKEVLRIDPYHNELALRLALNLTMKNRFHKNGRYQVETLLKDMIPQTKIDAAKEDKRRGYDLKQSWDNALKLLCGLGWSVTYDSETYPSWLQPGSQERKPKGYLNLFFPAIVTIHQPKPIPTLINSKASPTDPKPASSSKSETLTPAKLRQLRESKGLSQRGLATSLGVSASLIQMLEQGKRDIKPEFIKKIKYWMETCTQNH